MEQSIGTIHKATLEHLLNFKRTSDGGTTTVCNHASSWVLLWKEKPQQEPAWWMKGILRWEKKEGKRGGTLVYNLKIPW